MLLHPASLILAWIAAAIALQQASLAGLAATAVIVAPAVFFLAPQRAWRMIKRSRWLLLSLALLFVFATPGEYVSPIPGVTREGLELAAEHLLRLALLLLLLALLLERVDTARLMSGMYLLLSPAARLGFDRAQAVVRLMLVLDYVEGAGGATHWRDWLTVPAESTPIPLRLPVIRLGNSDYLLVAVALAALLGVLFLA
jgi:energy-coupling factor transporter transmembrane protein EcfT